MINKASLLSRRAQRLISNFGRASRSDEMSGGGDPADIPAIAHNLRVERAKLGAYIELLESRYTSLGSPLPEVPNVIVR